jgi:hypothetical protein
MAAESERLLQVADEQGESDAVTEFEMTSISKDADELHAIQKLINYAKRRLPK